MFINGIFPTVKLGKMEITSIDEAGRIVLPKEMREKLGITKKTKLLVTEARGDLVILKKIDIEKMAKQLEVELKRVKLDAIFRKVRDETNEKIRRAYSEIFTRH